MSGSFAHAQEPLGVDPFLAVSQAGADRSVVAIQKQGEGGTSHPAILLLLALGRNRDPDLPKRLRGRCLPVLYRTFCPTCQRVNWTIWQIVLANGFRKGDKEKPQPLRAGVLNAVGWLKTVATATFRNVIVLPLGADKVQPHSERPKGCPPWLYQERRKSAVKIWRWCRLDRKG